MNQNEQILSYLKMGSVITPIEALQNFGCFRLASRIYDLKQDGWPIVTDKIRLENGKVVGHYTLNQDRSLWPQ
jgi:hypothetical protein